jgi:predicted nucleic acid-binding protein
MNYLVDATYVIDLFTNQPHALTMLPTLLADGFGISVVTELELWEGVYMGRDPKAAALNLRQFLSGVKVLPVSRLVARRCARLRGELRAQKRPVQHRAFDLLIAATALQYRLIMVTSDTDFDDIPRLQRLNPRTSSMQA